MRPDIRYCTTADGVGIAYTVVGQGSPLVYAPRLQSCIEQEWRDDAEGLPHLKRLAEYRSVVQFDKRGFGFSDRSRVDVTMDTLVMDLAAVVDHLGLERFGLFGVSQAGPVAIRYAASRPERVGRLILHGTFASGARSGHRVNPDLTALMRSDWRAASMALAELQVPSSEDPVATVERARELRMIGDGRAFAALLDLLPQMDVTEELGSVQAPTLVTRRLEDPLSQQASAQELATSIPDARLMQVRGKVHAPFEGEDADEIVTAILEFLGESPQEDGEVTALPGPAVHTILFTDLEASTPLTVRLGDEQAQEVIRGHNTTVRAALDEHGGREVKHTGDGIMASFPSAVNAVLAAMAMQRQLAGGEVRVRVGLNAGEPIAEDDDLFGQSVIMASRICDRAEPGQVLVSNVVRELCAGKGCEFTSVGEATLKGFDEPVTLYEVRA